VVTTGDFNRDGKIDIAVGDYNKKVAILAGKGDGTFAAQVMFSVPAPVTYLTQGDFRGDGIEDLVAVSTDFTSNTLPEKIFLLSGHGDGTFSSPVSIAAGANPYWLTVGDFNGDGAQDLVVSDYQSSGLILMLNQRGTRITMSRSSGWVKAGQSVELTATVAATVPGASEPTGTAALKDGNKTIGIARLEKGKATLATSSLGPGVHTIRASYWGSSSFNPHVSEPVSVTVK
jgi:hypothetical protein